MRIHRNEKYMMAATSGCRRRRAFKMSDIETTDVDMFTIGNNLRELREQKRVTQMQVVDVLGVSYTHYAKIEEGMRGMSLKMLIKLIRYFETDANTTKYHIILKAIPVQKPIKAHLPYSLADIGVSLL